MAQRDALRVRHNGPTGSPNRRLPGAGSGWRRGAGATARGMRSIGTRVLDPRAGRRAQRLGRSQRPIGAASASARGLGVAAVGRTFPTATIVHTAPRSVTESDSAPTHCPHDTPSVTTTVQIKAPFFNFLLNGKRKVPLSHLAPRFGRVHVHKRRRNIAGSRPGKVGVCFVEACSVFTNAMLSEVRCVAIPPFALMTCPDPDLWCHTAGWRV